jgi:quercetin dioxygenase-like cupin family protein
MNAVLEKIPALMPSFSGFDLKHGVLCDMRNDRYPTTLSAWRNDILVMEAGATHFGYVHEGRCTVSCDSGEFKLGAGMYFCLPGKGTVYGSSSGIVIARHGYRGLFQIGGPVEEKGRLKYIDGCTDSLLVPPVMLGDPCVNLLYFPTGIHQTQHTHPSMRVGIVASGSGICVTPAGVIPLLPGKAFVIHAEGLHSFTTHDQPMRVIAYHPDSDFGPTDENHPMINRTIVDGVSASALDEIRTK